MQKLGPASRGSGAGAAPHLGSPYTRTTAVSKAWQVTYNNDFSGGRLTSMPKSLGALAMMHPLGGDVSHLLIPQLGEGSST